MNLEKLIANHIEMLKNRETDLTQIIRDCETKYTVTQKERIELEILLDKWKDDEPK